MKRGSAQFKIGRIGSRRTHRRVALRLLPSRQERLHSIRQVSSNLRSEIADLVTELAKEGEWSAALRIAETEGHSSQASIARELKVMRSTVARWASGDTAPLPALLDGYVRKLATLVLAPADESGSVAAPAGSGRDT